MLVKLASLVLVLGGSLLLANAVSAQEPVYASAPRPAYAAGAPARAHESGDIHDLSAHERPKTASGLLYVPWFRGIGIGLKLGVEIPIVPEGFIPRLNDSISIEPAFSIAYTNYYAYSDVSTTNYVAAVGGLWSFWLKSDLRVYGAVNLGVNIYSYHWDHGNNGHADNNVEPYVELAGGVFYKLNERVALRGEVGWYGPRGGVSIYL
jgi:hypothetical protein